MDYLDPKKKKAHKIRLLLGYVLFAVAILLATILLVFIANGYYVDRNTGQVIQNGLIFIDSKPTGAEVFINGQKQRGTTDMRLVIPGGETYTIDIQKEGYRPWSRTLLLESGTLRELTYARLIPEELITEPLADISANPYSASQSVDKRWLSLTYQENPLLISVFDLSTAVPTEQQIIIPQNIVPNASTARVEIIDWASDNRTFIAEITSGNLVNYVLFDRQDPEVAVNLNTRFGSNNLEISLQDRARDRFFAFNKETKLLYSATLNGGLSESPVVDKELLAYATFENDWFTYITESGKEGLVQAWFTRGDKTILLTEIKTDSDYFVELAKLGDTPIMAVGSPAEDRAIVYRDPQRYLDDNPEVRIPVATTVLRVKNPQDVIISSDSSVILAYGPENMASHEFDADRSYNFTLDIDIQESQRPRWLDGQHISVSAGGIQYTIDFDGSNVYELVASPPRLGSFYSEDVETMFTFSDAVVDEAGVIVTPPRLLSTSLLIPQDQ